MPAFPDDRSFLTACWFAGVERVRGEGAVRQTLERSGPERIENLLAVGKAASSMCLGALDRLAPGARGLLVTKYGHVDRKLLEAGRVEIMEAAHPVPDLNSLAAGQRVMDFVASVPKTQNLVVLVSGGASALVEVLPPGFGLSDLENITETLLSHDFDISRINAVRRKISGIKGGKLLSRSRAHSLFVYAVSDVPSDDIAVIGSGIGATGPVADHEPDMPAEFSDLARFQVWDEFMHARPDRTDPSRITQQVIASNTLARNAAARFAAEQGYPVVLNEESLHGPVETVASRVYGALEAGSQGVYVWGGEPTVALPPVPGRGGRNQHLALCLSKWFRGMRNISLIVAGTDGTDGPTDAAGGVIDGRVFDSVPGAEDALKAADSGSFLERSGALFVTGPTGTNVMDLIIAVKS